MLIKVSDVTRLVKRAEKVLRRKGRGYDRLTRLYVKKRMEDPGIYPSSSGDMLLF